MVKYSVLFEQAVAKLNVSSKQKYILRIMNVLVPLQFETYFFWVDKFYNRFVRTKIA